MRRKMAAVSFDPKLNQAHMVKNSSAAKLFASEEIEGLIKVFSDGCVERPLVIPSVPCGTRYGVVSRDALIDTLANVWARIYAPCSSQDAKLPLLVYFHGGGFCVGSAAWVCYHEFLSNLSCVARCVIVSVDYRLAPENRLPAAYEDGVNTLKWIQQHASNGASDQRWWTRSCNFSSLFLSGDSAGANIAHNLAIRIASHETSNLSPLLHKGTVLIQPFFGGEARTNSEHHSVQSAHSILSLPASDTYWRLSLPLGSNRDHPWCNPIANGAASRKWQCLKLAPTLVCISEMDILRDRNLEFCTAMAGASRKIEKVVYKGVGHAFQVLNRSPLAQTRTQEMILHLKNFIHQ